MRSSPSSLLPLLLVWCAATTSSVQADLPEAWAAANVRFEDFISARAELWPPANLAILPDATVIHEVPIRESRTEHLTLAIYQEGSLALSTIIGDPGSFIDKVKMLSPDVYTLCVLSSGPLGYQHHYPIVRFELVVDEVQGSQERKARMVTLHPPIDPEEMWPNERLLLFRDFHVFPKRNPFEIRGANEKVSPAVLLQVHENGVVERALLDPLYEQHLVWRIYHNGLLVNRSEADGVARLDTDRGPGHYLVLVGIEGAGGFMPVSNFLEYPLFPGGAGHNVIFPSQTNGMPDFLIDRSPPDQMQNLRESWPEDGAGAYSAKTIYAKEALGRLPDQNHQRLADLWKAWAWHLNQYRSQPDSAPWIIP